MEKLILSGYISVYSALISGSRQVFKVLYDKERFAKVTKSNFHFPEKKQYAFLNKACREKKITTEYVKASDFPECFGNESGGIAAFVGERTFTPVNELLALEKPFLCALDGIEDPYNFGQVLRSFYASGVDGVVIPKRNFFTASAIVARASAGASELLRISACDDLEGFCDIAKDGGIELIATAANDNAEDLFTAEFTRPLCVIIGGERRGISKKIAQKCRRVVKINYPRASNMSLSASSAAAVIAFEIGRRF